MSIRIAKIKFSQNSKLYDYLCPDKTIDEEDVVFLEGKDEPYYIYEIKEVEEKDCKATKKVLSKAKLNENVILETKYMDIVKSDCECIVNSLGPKTDIFGAICASIVNTANSVDINNMLKNNPTAPIGKIFVTDAGELPSKHIIHIVMPFKKDDNFNQNLKNAFSSVIDKAIENKYESIAIPYIGTGANGYSTEDIHYALNKILFKYQYKENIKIKIISIIYNSAGNKLNLRGRERILYGNSSYENYFNEIEMVDCIKLDTKNGSYPFKRKNPKNTYYYQDKKTQFILKAIEENYNGEDEFEIPNVDNPVDYIRQFKKEKKKKFINNFYDISNDINNVLPYSNQTKVTTGERKIKREEIINLGIACRMNFTEFFQFLFFSGVSLATNSKEDVELFLLKYLITNKRFSGLSLTYNKLGDFVSVEAINTIYVVKESK